MKNYLKITLSLVLIMSLILTACSSQSKEANEGDEDELNIGSPSIISTFDPHDSISTHAHSILLNIFDYLVERDDDGEFIPGLATDWERKDDKTMRFNLREDVKFSNGDSFTADDVKFSLERIAKNEEFTNQHNFKEIDEVEVIDDYTVDIITSEPDPILLNRISRNGSEIMPNDYFEEVGEDEFAEEPIGTGPYQVSDWERDSEINLEPNEEYWGDDQEWEAVNFYAMSEDSTRVSELLTGKLDIAEETLPTDVERIDSNEGTESAIEATKRVLYLVIPTDEGPTAESKVREAIELAIDKETLIEQLYDGNATPTRTLTTPSSFASDSSLYDTVNYDPEKAKQLLKEAGYEDGFSIELNTSQSDDLKVKDGTEMIAAMLKEVGIEADIQSFSNSDYTEKRKAHSLEGIFNKGISSSMADPSTDYIQFTSEEAEGDSNYDNPEFEELYEKATKSMDDDKREKLYKEIQQILAEDRPLIPLYQLDGYYGKKENIDFEPREDQMLYADEVKRK